MAKVALPKIVREDTAWGVRLSVRPFPDPQYAIMEISVEISEPKPGRSAEIRTRFTSVPPAASLRSADLTAWMGRMNQIQAEARSIADEMKAKVKKPIKKKSAKK